MSVENIRHVYHMILQNSLGAHKAPAFDTVGHVRMATLQTVSKSWSTSEAKGEECQEKESLCD
eukprot:73262-Hanusia_phi.AAC.1